MLARYFDMSREELLALSISDYAVYRSVYIDQNKEEE